MTFIENTPYATVKDVAEVLHLTVCQCECTVTGMKKKGLIYSVGSTESGNWEIIRK